MSLVDPHDGNKQENEAKNFARANVPSQKQTLSGFAEINHIILEYIHSRVPARKWSKGKIDYYTAVTTEITTAKFL